MQIHLKALPLHLIVLTTTTCSPCAAIPQQRYQLPTTTAAGMDTSTRHMCLRGTCYPGFPSLNLALSQRIHFLRTENRHRRTDSRYGRSSDAHLHMHQRNLLYTSPEPPEIPFFRRTVPAILRKTPIQTTITF
ncbi:hypothetical protein BOTBODRAFT_383883 [Botryobasidium botryosum FD-172 SS1]|uniref:Secreted protein n=1 Tax=Botryobasidium botryosum (strain FD-172 SS1) TaxID=930990 RepID=A0A067MZ71_BOTB1|nr:hypothetical protein BOTBODRAFT_383883 [Botryobasidium botryosum FD-172 SS1]